MERDRWKFTFSDKALAEATKKKIAYHSKRLQNWNLELEKAQDKFKKTVVDEGIAQRLNRCASKVDKHKKMKQEYKAYLGAFETSAQDIVFDMNWRPHSGRSFDLDMDDIVFFGLFTDEESKDE